MNAVGPAPAEILAPTAADLLRIRSPRGRALVGGFSLAHFAHHVVNMLLGPLLPLIRDTFALSYAQAGLAVSAYNLSLGLANAPMGVLADRIGPRLVLAAGLILVGLAGVALALAGAYWQLLAVLIAMGVISATYHPPAVALLTRAFPERTRGSALGLHTTGGSLAVFAAPVIAGYVAGVTGTWRSAYLWCAAVPIAAGAAVWLLAPSEHVRASAVGRLAAFREATSVLRQAGRILTLAIVFRALYGTFLAFLAIYLVDARHVSVAIAAALFAVPQAAAVFGPPLGGWLSDRIGRRAVIAIGIGALGPAVWAFTAAPTALIVAPLALAGLAAGIPTTVTEVLVAENTPVARRATALGTYYLISSVSSGLAAPAFGALAGATGIAAGLAGLGATLTAVSVVTLALAVARRL